MDAPPTPSGHGTQIVPGSSDRLTGAFQVRASLERAGMPLDNFPAAIQSPARAAGSSSSVVSASQQISSQVSASQGAANRGRSASRYQQTPSSNLLSSQRAPLRGEVEGRVRLSPNGRHLINLSAPSSYSKAANAEGRNASSSSSSSGPAAGNNGASSAGERTPLSIGQQSRAFGSAAQSASKKGDKNYATGGLAIVGGLSMNGKPRNSSSSASSVLTSASQYGMNAGNKKQAGSSSSRGGPDGASSSSAASASASGDYQSLMRGDQVSVRKAGGGTTSKFAGSVRASVAGTPMEQDHDGDGLSYGNGGAGGGAGGDDYDGATQQTPGASSYKKGPGRRMGARAGGGGGDDDGDDDRSSRRSFGGPGGGGGGGGGGDGDDDGNNYPDNNHGHDGHDHEQGHDQDQDQVADEAMIWGTTIVISQVMNTFRSFLQTYEGVRAGANGGSAEGDASGEDGASTVGSNADHSNSDSNNENENVEPHYMRVIRELAQSGGKVLSIDVRDFVRWSQLDGFRLLSQLRAYPNEVIPIMDIVVNQELERVKDAIREAHAHSSGGGDAEGYLSAEESEQLLNSQQELQDTEHQLSMLEHTLEQAQSSQAALKEERAALAQQVEQRSRVEHLDGSSADDESSESAELQALRQRLREATARLQESRDELKRVSDEASETNARRQQLTDYVIAVRNRAAQLAAEYGAGGDGVFAASQGPIKVRVHNLEVKHRMRDLDPMDIDTLVSVRGMVVRCSAPIPDMKSGYFRCVGCGSGVSVDVDRGHLHEPDVCLRCGSKRSFEMVHNRCVFLDKQHIKMQETPESIPEGETPQTILLYAFQELVDGCAPGDRVEITGIYRAIGIRPNPRQRALRSVFKTYIDIIHIKKGGGAGAAGKAGDGGGSGMGIDERVASEEPNLPAIDGLGSMLPSGPAAEDDEVAAAGAGRDSEMDAWNNDIYAGGSTANVLARRQRVFDMSNDPHLYSHLAASLAPSIWEMEDVKKGVLLQLFGGCVKDFGKEGKMRGEVNILLVGDPGVAKSQLLSYVHKLSSRGIYTSGKGSSAVGLTASIGKDPETREPVLESGALVLSDRGVCCIDEFDKMSDTTRVILHEVMEQQTVSIAKAGIIATLNARTSILAAANPIESRYNPRLSIVENLQLPPTLLSRFDLIYLLLDQENPESDAQLAAHLVSLYEDPATRASAKSDDLEAKAKDKQVAAVGSGPLGAIYSTSQVAEYISYARAYCTPVISDDARAVIVNGYVEMRKLGLKGGNAGKKTITATTRQLESIIRLSEAHARMRLSRTVEPQDVTEALRLIRVATQTAAIDPRTGQIDMSRLITGHSAEEGDIVTRLVALLRENFSNKSRNYTITVGQLVKDLAAIGAAGGPAIQLGDGDAAFFGDAEGYGGGGGSTADSLPPGALLGISADEVLEALRILETDDNPVIRLQGTGKVMVIG